MENITMIPMTDWRIALASTHCATSATVLDICDVKDVDVRDAVRATERVHRATTAAPKAALVADRDRATVTGKAGFAAGSRPGSPAWSPPL